MGKILFAVVSLLLLAAQMASAADVPKITLEKITAYGTEARIEWKTNELTTSVLTVLDQVRKFENLREFSTTIQSLEPGKKYSFEIIACDASINCGNYQGEFTTSAENKPLPEEKQGITGAVISADVFKEAKSIALVVFYGLLAVVVLGVVARTGYNAISGMSNTTERQMKNSMRSAEELIKAGRKEEAFAHYNDARALYSRVSPERQAKYYDQLIATYSVLQQHRKAKEAGRLADRYIAGSITREELERLRDLLV
ncbi:MAG: hypothetical protein V1702_04465 [Candidatus Woesearchaeota archaeon]